MPWCGRIPLGMSCKFPSCFVALHSQSLGSTVNTTPIDCRVTIELRKRRFGRSGWIVASCGLDLSSAGDKGERAHVDVKRGSRSRSVFIPAEIRLDLKDNANGKFGELIICVASSVVSTGETVQNPSQAGEQLGPGLPTINALVSTGEAVQNAGQTSEQLGPGQPTVNNLVSTVEAVQNAGQAAEQLGPGLPAVNDAIQAIAPLATEIADQFGAWQPLLGRLGALVKVADAVAEVRFILNSLGSAITKNYLQNRFTPGSSWHGVSSRQHIRYVKIQDLHVYAL
jgi:hypothetical protein